MSAHLSHEVLWSLDQHSQAEAAAASAHLGACELCRAALEDIQFSKRLLVAPGPVPELPAASARRIGEVLFEAAAAQALRRDWWRGWWPFSFHPGYALAGAMAAALALAAYVGRLPSSGGPGPEVVAQLTPVVAPPAPPLVPPEVKLPDAPVSAPRKLQASVTSARSAKDRGAALKKAQVLEEGAQLATARGGALWLKLPDGSRAGLSGDSRVQLTTLEERQVAMALGSGSLVVVAQHRPQRTLTVQAGELEVVDVGTRFLVSRDVRRTLVAVEEGSVEVRVGGQRTAVRAGQAVEWRDGHLTEQTWASAEEPAPRAVPPAPAPELKPGDDTPPIAPLPEGAVRQPPPAPAEPAAPSLPQGDDWSTPETLRDVPPALAPPVVAADPSGATLVPPPAPAAQAEAESAPPVDAPVTKEDEAADLNFLQKMERKLRQVRNDLHRQFLSPPASVREAQAREVSQLADDHSCAEALRRADSWLQSTPSGGDDVNHKRAVLGAKLKCFKHQGRTGDADRLQRELDGL